MTVVFSLSTEATLAPLRRVTLPVASAASISCNARAGREAKTLVAWAALAGSVFSFVSVIRVPVELYIRLVLAAQAPPARVSMPRCRRQRSEFAVMRKAKPTSWPVVERSRRVMVWPLRARPMAAAGPAMLAPTTMIFRGAMGKGMER